MGGNSSVGGLPAVLSNTQLAVELQATSLRTQIVTVGELGRLAVNLIHSATLPPDTGAQLDIRA
ncbi:MAG: hypothetical protein QGG73_07725 [Candidatus Hydrogenedentes bacterium]|jgi:hypothetical protein|nr:hypothetical protein [Candidatus Hydrogenedentota bacterium]